MIHRESVRWGTLIYVPEAANMRFAIPIPFVRLRVGTELADFSFLGIRRARILEIDRDDIRSLVRIRGVTAHIGVGFRRVDGSYLHSFFLKESSVRLFEHFGWPLAGMRTLTFTVLAAEWKSEQWR